MNSIPRSVGQSFRQVRENCREHPEEEVQYFCFECNVPPVCPECVIHGEHRGHKVQLLKKAYPTIVKTIDELQIQIKTKVDELELQDQKLNSRKREVHEQQQTAKQYMANSFEELRQRIDQKERELMQKCDDQAHEHMAELEFTVKLIKGRQTTLVGAIEDLDEKIKHSDDAGLVQFYAENFETIKRTCLIDSELPQLKEIPDRLNLNAKIDTSTLDEFLKGVQTVQVCIDNFGSNDQHQKHLQDHINKVNMVKGSYQDHMTNYRSGSNNNHHPPLHQATRTQVSQQSLGKRQASGNIDLRNINYPDNQSMNSQPQQTIKSVFQVAYSQKGQKDQKGNLQVSVAQTMARLQGQNKDVRYQPLQCHSSVGGSIRTRSIEDENDEY